MVGCTCQNHLKFKMLFILTLKLPLFRSNSKLYLLSYHLLVLEQECNGELKTSSKTSTPSALTLSSFVDLSCSPPVLVPPSSSAGDLMLSHQECSNFGSPPLFLHSFAISELLKDSLKLWLFSLLCSAGCPLSESKF